MSRRHPAAPQDKFSPAYRHPSSSPQFDSVARRSLKEPGPGARHTRHIGAVHEDEKAIREPSRMAFQMNCRCSFSGSVHLLSVQRDNEDERVSFHAGRATSSILLTRDLTDTGRLRRCAASRTRSHRGGLARGRLFELFGNAEPPKRENEGMTRMRPGLRRRARAVPAATG
jgi:hypothetical protein